MVVRALLMIAMLAIGPGRAVAQDVPPLHRNRLGVDLGIGSALGARGLTYQFALSRWWRFEGGVGWGLSGVQFSAMPKVALGGENCSFIAGFGPAVGVGSAFIKSDADNPNQPDAVGWLNLDVPGLECHSD